MKRLLNTLYVTKSGSSVGKEGKTVRVTFENETLIRVPVHTLEGIVCFGRVFVTPEAMWLCVDRDVAVSFMTEHGRFIAKVQGAVSGNVLVRRAQYRMADDLSTSAGIARSVVIGKVANCRTVIMRAARESEEEDTASALKSAASRLTRILEDLQTADRLESIRGCEGEAGQVYFGVFDRLITGDRDVFSFHCRSRRPPLDAVNALLSFLYTLLLHDASSALETTGLDPYVGYLHRDRPGRLGLALDLMEEFRPFLADRLTLTLINRRQIGRNDLRRTESGAVLLTDEGRKTVLVAYQNRKRETLRHPFIDEEMEIGLLQFVQARLLARFIREELDGYPPFLWR